MMSTVDLARKIGRQKASIAITAGLVVAYVLMALIDGSPLWIFEFEYTLNLLFGVFLLYVFGYYVGGISGKLILIKKYPALLIGLFSGFVMTGAAVFIGGFLGFFQEGLSSGWYAFEDYVLKPVLMVWFWGFLPLVLIGLWYGWSVKRRKFPETRA